VNLISRFNPGVPFTDAPNGFFGILRKTFQTLATEEDAAAKWEGLDLPIYPDFGTAKSDYETEVKTFYGVWVSFSTQKSFSWRDRYRTSDAPDRANRRFAEKENKKLRDAGIREFNEAVVALVTFVRRRDPRYLPNLQTDAERQKTLRDAAASQAKRARAANQAKINQHVVPEWSKTSSRLPEEGSFEEEEEEVVETIECVACGKIFKSEKQYEAHERSKKHIKTVQQMQREIRKENKRLGLPDEDSEINIQEFQKMDIGDINGEKDYSPNVDEEGNNTEEEQELRESSHGSPPSTFSSSDVDDSYAPREAVESRLAASLSEEVPDSTDSTIVSSITNDKASFGLGVQQKLGKAKAKRAKKAAREQSEAGTEEFRCAACNNEFASKTKLFNHIKEHPNHAQPVPKGIRGKKL
jgi:DnaJ family protein A protein 5